MGQNGGFSSRRPWLAVDVHLATVRVDDGLHDAESQTEAPEPVVCQM